MNPNIEPACTGPTLWPAEFLWGVATAAHQIEGNNLGSDYWLLEHLQPTSFIEPSGDCCDSWQRWPEDHALVAGLGLNAYRFSVEWARVEPEEGAFSAAVLAHYRRQCESLRERGISPVVTLHHFSSPRWLAARGGWEYPGTPDLFARYAERVAHALGDTVGAWCTLNEPNAQVNSYIVRGERPADNEAAIVAAACKALGSYRFGSYFMGDSLRVRDVCIRAHALGVQALGAVSPQIPSGMTLALQALECGDGGQALYERLFEQARRPFYEAAARDAFIGVQPYMRFRTGPAGFLPPPDGVELDRWGHDASPNVLEAAVREAARCTGTAVYVRHQHRRRRAATASCAGFAARLAALHRRRHPRAGLHALELARQLRMALWLRAEVRPLQRRPAEL